MLDAIHENMPRYIRIYRTQRIVKDVQIRVMVYGPGQTYASLDIKRNFITNWFMMSFSILRVSKKTTYFLASAKRATILSNESIFTSRKQIEISGKGTKLKNATEFGFVHCWIKAHVSLERCVK